jgi:hypothetical protein
MLPRNILLAAGAVVVLGALLLLLVELKGSSEVDVPEDLLAQARDHYARNQVRRPGTPPPAPPPASAPRPRGPRGEMPPPPDRSQPALGEDDGPPPEQLIAMREARLAEISASAKGDLNMDRRKIGLLYDSGKYDEALEVALSFLKENPDERYVRRVVVTSACALGDTATARSYFEDMHATDRTIVVKRCARFGVDL